MSDAQELKEAWLQIQEQRILGAAAELAGRLVVGDACPVCGSADHPHPAAKLRPFRRDQRHGAPPERRAECPLCQRKPPFPCPGALFARPRSSW